MILESVNDQTSKLFTPMKDYVPFSSKEDLVDKLRYYLNHEDELMAIAVQGRLTAIKNYSSNRFWQLLLNKLELNKNPRPKGRGIQTSKYQTAKCRTSTRLASHRL